MKPRSAKNKGKRLQNEVRERLLEAFMMLEEDDIKSTTMGESGEDVQLSPAARKLIPYSFECKNQEKLSIWSALQQAEENAKPNTTPAVIFRRNRSKTYVALEFEHFVSLLGDKE